jgi:hypothetical protein
MHARGKPLKPFTGSTADQMCFATFGLTYRERLTEVEREIAWQRTHLFNATTGAERVDPNAPDEF